MNDYLALGLVAIFGVIAIIFACCAITTLNNHGLDSGDAVGKKKED